MLTPKKVAILYNVIFQHHSPDASAHIEIEHTAQHIYQTLMQGDKYDVVLIPVSGHSLDFLAQLKQFQPHVVFNLCESLNDCAEFEYLIPAVLQFQGWRYTGNSAWTLMNAVRKDRTKLLLQMNQIATPDFIVSERHLNDEPYFGFPCIVKPVAEDGSLGISCHSVVHNIKQMNDQIAYVVDIYRQPALIEQYIAGREINIPILSSSCHQVLPWTEISFDTLPQDRPAILTYQGKWNESSIDYQGTIPHLARHIDAVISATMRQMADDTCRALEMSSYGRIDFRLNTAGRPFIIDVNPNCDLSLQGGFFRAISASGMSYHDMCDILIMSAFKDD